MIGLFHTVHLSIYLSITNDVSLLSFLVVFFSFALFHFVLLSCAYLYEIKAFIQHICTFHNSQMNDCACCYTYWLLPVVYPMESVNYHNMVIHLHYLSVLVLGRRYLLTSLLSYWVRNVQLRRIQPLVTTSTAHTCETDSR